MWKTGIILIMSLWATSVLANEENNEIDNSTHVNETTPKVEVPGISCYNGVGLFKFKTECSPGTTACAYVKTPISWSYICGGNETMDGCYNVTHVDVKVSDSGRFETCYCTTGDNCNPAALYGPNWQLFFALVCLICLKTFWFN